jgi:hypothetical protein
MITSPARRWAIRAAGLCSCFGLVTCGGGDGPSDPGLNLSASNVSFESDFGTIPASKTVTITTTGEQATGLTSTTSFTGAQNDWLSAIFDTENASGNAPATLTLEVTRADLPTGSHSATVVISSDNAGNSPEVTVVIQVAATNATQLALTTPPPGTVRSGEPFSQAPVVQLQDEAGDPVDVAGVQVTVTLEGGPALDGLAAITTDAGGAATFGGLSIIGLAGQRTLVFQAPGVPDLASDPITVEPGDPAQITATSDQTQNTQAGEQVDEPPAVVVTDGGGNPIEGVEVTFAVTGGGTIAPTTPVTTNGSGQAALEFWELGDAAGASTVTASADGLAGSPVTFSATGTVGVATDLTIVSPDNLQGPVGTIITHRVRVTDNAGNSVPDIAVDWSAASGGGSVAPTTSSTNNNGVAATDRTLGPTPGENTTTASATLNGVLKTVTFTTTANTGGPAQTVLVAGDGQTGTVGNNLEQQLQVRVLDLDDVPQPAVTVTWDILDGEGSFPSGTTSQTDGNGVATATWRLGNIAGEQRARASAAGDPVIFTATADPDQPSAVTSTLERSSSFFTAGSSATVTATARDQFNNLIGGASVDLSSNASGQFGDASLTTATTGGNQGKASTSYSSTVAGVHTITAAISAGGTINETVQIEVRAAAANTTMAPVTSTAGSATFGAAVPVLPAVLVTDQFNNPVANVPVSWSLLQGKGSVSFQAQTNSSGVAAVTAWTLTALSPGYDTDFAVVNQVRASAAVSTGSPVTFTRTVQVSFTNVQTLFGTVEAGTTEGTCLGSGCHIGPLVLDLRPANSFVELVGTGSGTVYVTPSDSTTVSSSVNRLLFRLKQTGTSSMPTPGRGGTLPANIITIIAAWVAQGATGP